jgi:hypothetical protein
MRELGRWLFGIHAVRMTALAVLFLFPEWRRKLRIYVGVEGGMDRVAGLLGNSDMDDINAPHDPQAVSAQALKTLAPRVAQIYADLDGNKQGGAR